MKLYTIHVSQGNNKMGRVLNSSMTPIESCGADVPCKKDGYCHRPCKRFAKTRAAWAENLAFYRADPDGYFAQLDAHLVLAQPDMYRSGVAGDMPDEDYLRRMYALARRHTGTKFLIFTKRHEYSFKGRPRNVSVVLSMWPNWGNTKKRMPRAWLDDPANPDPRIPDDAIKYSGKCETCGVCWDLAQLGHDVRLKKI